MISSAIIVANSNLSWIYLSISRYKLGSVITTNCSQKNLLSPRVLANETHFVEANAIYFQSTDWQMQWNEFYLAHCTVDWYVEKDHVQQVSGKWCIERRSYVIIVNCLLQPCTASSLQLGSLQTMQWTTSQVYSPYDTWLLINACLCMPKTILLQ